MRQIGWILISTSRKYGGGANYRKRLNAALGSDFHIEQNLIEAKFLLWKYLKPIEWIWRFFHLKDKKDLWIMHTSDVVAALSFMRIKGKKLAIIHHIDDRAVFPIAWRPFLFVLHKLFYRNLRKMDAIVTVSEYWKHQFLKRGYQQVYKIYNGFPVEEFHVSEEEVVLFKKKFALDEKPILYIGNCQKAKGVVEAYRELKDLPVHIVTSGEQRVRVPTRNLDLAYRDYLILLKASAIVIAMSRFKEGWCATLHEAMLLKTPVIGSGLGGMRELLEGGKQIICPDFRDLKRHVQEILNNPAKQKELGAVGREFARAFTLERFGEEWKTLMRKLTT